MVLPSNALVSSHITVTCEFVGSLVAMLLLVSGVGWWGGIMEMWGIQNWISPGSVFDDWHGPGGLKVFEGLFPCCVSLRLFPNLITVGKTSNFMARVNVMMELNMWFPWREKDPAKWMMLIMYLDVKKIKGYGRKEL